MPGQNSSDKKILRQRELANTLSRGKELNDEDKAMSDQEAKAFGKDMAADTISDEEYNEYFTLSSDKQREWREKMIKSIIDSNPNLNKDRKLYELLMDEDIRNCAGPKRLKQYFVFGYPDFLKSLKFEINGDVTNETIKKQSEYLEELEKEACQDLINEINIQNEINEQMEKQNREEVIKDSKEQEKNPLILGRTDKIKEQIVKIDNLTPDYGRVAIEGKVISTDSRELKNGKTLAMFNIYDGTSTITCKSFVEAEKAPAVLERLNEAKRLKISGNAQYDNFAKELGIIANIIVEIPDIEVVKRKDFAKEKRVELHLHTQMSQMDGVSSATDLIKRASSWGMKAIAITDHGVVKSFPEAKKAADKFGIKVLYGVEAYLVPDDNAIDLSNGMDEEYIVLDIETTGLSFRTEKITEIDAIKIKNGEIIDTFECFVNPEKPIPYEVIKVTHITDDMVRDAKTIEEVLPEFLDFCRR